MVFWKQGCIISVFTDDVLPNKLIGICFNPNKFFIFPYGNPVSLN